MDRVGTFLAIAAALLLAAEWRPRDAAGAEARAASATAAVERAIADRLASDARAPLRSLPVVYEAAKEPLWLDARGSPTGDAAVAVSLLALAADHGLEPADYDAAALTGRAAALRRAPAGETEEAAAFDVGLSAAMLLYLQELHEGRVDPRAIGFRMTVPPDDHDFAAILRDAVATHRLGAVAAAYAPQLDQYAALRQELARYRLLAADPTLTLASPTGATVSVHPGEELADAAALARLLMALGDLPDAAALPASGRHEGPLVDAVRRFQGRHGLAPDGIIGPRTRAAMAVPLALRVRQIELALERLRWLPHLDPGGFVLVNIPAFRLVAWGPAPAGAPPDHRGAPQLSMAVIVGRALDRETPVFAEQLEEIVFRPYWNVPTSILRGEILPAMRRDAGYLSRQDMEIVDGPGDDARAVAATADNLARLRAGSLRVRQRPGPRNALGLVKLVFPNDADVYLHGTPAPRLFQQARRDFSHGCIRVEDPVALAEWALAAEPGWDRSAIERAMNGDRQLRVRLARPRQVLLFYVTAIVRAGDQSLHFAADLYGHDARLDEALARRSRTIAVRSSWQRPGGIPPGGGQERRLR